VWSAEVLVGQEVEPVGRGQRCVDVVCTDCQRTSAATYNTSLRLASSFILGF